MTPIPNTAWGALSLAWELGFMIALPIVIFGTAGKYADRYFDTRPWLTLLGIFIAMGSSSIWLYRRMKPMVNAMKQ